MMNMNLKTLGDSLDGYTTGIYGTVRVNIMQRAILTTNLDSRSLVPGNQNGSGYKCISLAFNTKENLDIYNKSHSIENHDCKLEFELQIKFKQP